MEYERLRNREYEYLSNKESVRGLLTAGIKTLPICSTGGTLGFSANDIEYPNGSSQSFRDYERRCQRKKIIPYSYLELDYHPHRTKLFVPHQKTPTRLADDTNRSLAEGIMRGGRIHKLEINLCMGGAYRNDGFVKRFFEQKLPEVLEQGYTLHRARLFSRSDWGVERGEVPEILFEVEGKKGRLRLKLGKYTAPDEIQLLFNWFNQLVASVTQTEASKK